MKGYLALRGKGLKAVIFDLDGTLVASRIDWIGMKRRILSRLREVGVGVESLTIHHTTMEIVGRILDSMGAQGFDEERIREVLKEVDEVMTRAEMEGVEDALLRKGVQGVLKVLKARGFKVGILTRSCPAYAERVLEKWNLIDYIDAVNARSDLSKAKPNPEAFYTLCKSLGVDPGEALMVGDHPTDILCAKEAGAKAVGVLGGAADEETLRRAGCDLIIEEIPDLLGLSLLPPP